MVDHDFDQLFKYWSDQFLPDPVYEERKMNVHY